MKEEQQEEKSELGKKVYANSFAIEATIYDIQVRFLLGGEVAVIVLPPPLAAQVAQSLGQVAEAYSRKFGMPQAQAAPESGKETAPANGAAAEA